MATATQDDVNYNINKAWRKEGYIRVKVTVPGVKTVMAGLFGKKPDSRCCTLSVNFDDNKATIKATILSGEHSGKNYDICLDKDDLGIGRVMPAPSSYYAVVNNMVKLYIRHR